MCNIFPQLVDDNIFCVHGGLSPELRCIDQMQTIERVQEIPHTGSYCDLMWSDPEDILDWAVSPRGAGYLFGSKATKEVSSKTIEMLSNNCAFYGIYIYICMYVCM